MLRDRIASKLANFILRFATPRYQALVKGSIRYGLKAAQLDEQAASQPALLLTEPILDNHVIHCMKDNPVEGRCWHCRHEAYEYAQAAFSAIDTTVLAQSLQSEHGSDIGGYNSRDLNKFAIELKTFLTGQ